MSSVIADSKKDALEESSGSANEEGAIFEGVLNEKGELCFAETSVKDPTRQVTTAPNAGGYQPKKKTLWTAYQVPKPYVSIRSLYDEVKAYLEKYLYLPDHRYFHILTCFILATYRREDFDVATYLFFYGSFNCGKSRAEELISLLAYRGIKNENSSLASLYALIERYHPTLCLDETQKYNQKGRTEILDLLNSGQRCPGYVTRMEKSDDGKFEEKAYEVFGFKVLAGLGQLTRSLNSRCITVHMRRASRKVDRFRWKQEVAQTADLRAKLLYYRMQNLYKRTNIDYLLNQFSNDRNSEIFEPLLAVAPDQNIIDILLEIGKELEDEQAEEESASIEAVIMVALSEVVKLREQAMKNTLLAGALITIKEITDQANFNRAMTDMLKGDKVGRVLSRLGFKKARNQKASRDRCIVWNQNLYDDLANRYLPSSSGKASNVVSVVGGKQNVLTTSTTTTTFPRLGAADYTVTKETAQRPKAIAPASV